VGCGRVSRVSLRNTSRVICIERCRWAAQNRRGGCSMRLGVARPLRSARNSRSVSSLTRAVQLHNLDVPILTGAQKNPVGFLLYPPHAMTNRKKQIFTVFLFKNIRLSPGS
jgi:hypothetical protein